MVMVREIYGRRIRNTRRLGAFIRVTFFDTCPGADRKRVIMPLDRFLRDRRGLFVPSRQF